MLAVEYRGWGDSTPIIPSEQSIAADADSGWAELVKHQPDPKKRVRYGHSLGGAVAIDLASRKHRGTDRRSDCRVDVHDACRPRGIGRRTDRRARRTAVGAMLRFDHQDRSNRRADPDAARRARQHGAGVARPAAARRGAAGPARVEVPAGGHSQLFQDDPELYQRTMRMLIAQLAASS